MKTMKGYKVKVIAQITVDIWEDDPDLAKFNWPLTEFQAQQMAKADLCQKLSNDPNYGHIKITQIVK